MKETFASVQTWALRLGDSLAEAWLKYRNVVGMLLWAKFLLNAVGADIAHITAAAWQTSSGGHSESSAQRPTRLSSSKLWKRMSSD